MTLAHRQTSMATTPSERRPRFGSRRPRRIHPGWWTALVAAALLLTFAIDRETNAAPLRHLYYLPIILAAVKLGPWAGPCVASAAIVLYHLANPVLLTVRYGESDVVQVALFLTVGLVAARLTHDARRLETLAVTDDLTGLYNLRGFDERLRAMLRVARGSAASVSLLVLDVDRLKSLNDTHGHRTGADAVRAVGQVLGEVARQDEDVVACRFGGDEFVVGLYGHSAQEAEEVADRVRRTVHALAPVLAGVGFPAGALSISLGLTHLSPEVFSSQTARAHDEAWLGEALFRAADRAALHRQG